MNGSQISSSKETVQDVVRRLLKLPDVIGSKSRTDSQITTPKGMMGATSAGNGHGAIAGFLNSPHYLVRGSAVERFLSILAWLYNQHPEKFEKVVLLSGRKRRYFATGPEELEASGNSVMPKHIPNSPFWVITNSPTQLKKQMMEDVMRVLGYDASSTRMIVDAIR